jgi:L-asparagine permease
LLGRFRIQGQGTGWSVISSSGGFLPSGIAPLITVSTGAVFSYAAVELVGTAAGETENPTKAIPRAINSVSRRIAVWYVGSLALFAFLLPHSVFQSGESPFVTFFGRLGVHGAGTIMNIVVLTAAFSSLNAGMYATGRIVRSMAMNGSAPRTAVIMSRHGVPYAGIAAAGAVGLCGVVLNALDPGRAFDIVLNIASLGVIAAWATIVACQLRLWHLARRGKIRRPSFRLPGSPYTGIATLIFLAAIVVLEKTTLAALLVIVPVLIAGWFAARRRVASIARWRAGDTDVFPVVANLPLDPTDD